MSGPRHFDKLRPYNGQSHHELYQLLEAMLVDDLIKWRLNGANKHRVQVWLTCVISYKLNMQFKTFAYNEMLYIVRLA